ncbi:hypothetical protein [Kingella oralis]|uniref:hypothetical protein n=1 Tax=Kingella oralis TaxID=505 RepID=UPI0034E5B4BE
MRRVNAGAKVGQPEKLIRASTACWQAVRWQRMIWLNGLIGRRAADTPLDCFNFATPLWFQAAYCVCDTHNRQPETVCAGFTLAV